MLVTGLFTPSGGCVKIFGTDAGKIPDSIKRSIYGYVTQDMKEIPGTIIDQVTLKDPNVTREQAIEAIKFTGLYDELEGDIDRTDTSLSQGQKQLLGIARAIAPDPPILLFDEITSSLDSMTEERIVSVLKKAAEHHTVLSVSHRLTSLKNSDQLIYLENGRVRVCGTPDEVLAQIPDFEALIKSQENGWS
jgi:ATP-binding cassette subfamily B protein